ncbi:hypothetical protein PF005_g21977 [Phytophthora fragariae]|uniref:Chaperone protein n=1 Tax=Phytophthora fragariae TaxID=53985 RepID=A0A6A3E0G1_9STRA|nr:hypothetical protein PF003_g31872 [Phytophthora fragariae]KAE8926995.1 hypothetical protein PF009_g22825 [Phytophthora fragariae]KAE9107735.1 hypothetical protein PF006_g21032 [Phytophthora fragariae]KAE9125483.1 hypothetical protein PF007_g6340 [Phytophthora fragariae]KAE9183708.1 hypothetical protein PF005_g21977 [Phytophthora fragariae]
MTRQRRLLAYSAEYEFGDENILTATYLEETRLRNQQRIKHAQSVLDTESEDRTVNNAKRFQQELDREIEISQHNQILLQRLERIHKNKLPKQFDVSHHTEEHLSAQRPTNFPHWQREQERIAEENKKMKRRLDQTKSLFDSKQLAADAAKYRYFSEQLSKADRRSQVKQKCKQLELHTNSKRNSNDIHSHSPSKARHRHKRHHLNAVQQESEQCTLEGIHECHPDQHDSRGSRELPRVRASHKVESKYSMSQGSFPTVTGTSKLIPPRERISPPVMKVAKGVRHFHSTAPKLWLIPAGLACAGLFVGTRYILRAQERVRRRRAGLPGEGDEVDEGASSTMSKMQQVLGVDVGSANLRVATASLLDSTHAARVIESADGLRATPAAVAVDNGSVSVGAIAKALQGRKPGYTATATRLLLGGATREREELVRTLPYTVHEQGDTLQLELDGKTYSPEWAVEIMLDHLHTTAAASLGEDPIENFPAVLAVPAGTGEQERAAYEKIANSAGFTVFAAIDEPVAALHAVERCAVQELKSTDVLSRKGPIAVVDMGGYVSTVSLLEKERRGSGFNLLHTLSTRTVSGHRVNELLFRSVVKKFEEEHGIDLSVDYMASYRILEAVESAKIELSSRGSTDINLPFITADQKGAKHLVHKVTSFDLARIQEGPAQEAIALCSRALNDSGVSKKELSALVLVGGGAKSEFIRQQLESFFELSAFNTKSFSPEEAVVLGAAEYGRKLVQE